MNDNVQDRSADDAVFETLLAESLGGASPPDLTGVILRRLDVAAIPSRRVERATSRRRPRSRRWGALLIAATAASVALAVQWRDRTDGPVEVAIAPTVPTPARPSVSVPPDKRTPGRVAPARTLTPRDVFVAKPQPGVETQLAQKPEDSDRLAPPIDQPAAEVRATLVAAWDRQGVTPQPPAAAAEVTGRLSERLGVTVGADAMASAQTLARPLKQPENRRSIAAALLRHWGIKDDKTAAELADHLDRGVDAVFARWLRPGGRWGSLTESMPQHQRIVTTAAAAMNVDLRCSRCHDDLVGLPAQADYWSFAAALESRPTGLFYDRPDGRRQMSGTQVRGDWVADGETALRGDWIDRPRLAQSIVAAVWEIVHGQPLRPSAYDLSSVPADGLGDRIEQSLAVDLVASGFDVVRLVAIVATGGAIDRQVPPALLPQGLLIATDDQVRDAMHAVDAFAAASGVRPVAAESRLAMVRREIDRRDVGLAADVPTTLAQIQPTGESPAMTRADAGDAALAVVQTGGVTAPGWWTSLDAGQRIDHLVYLAGLERLDQRQRVVLERLQSVSDDPSLFLQQAWWMIRR